MYDNEEEIQRKRKKLFLIIGVIVFLILLLIIILIVRAGSKKKPSIENDELGCELIVTKGTHNAQNVYTSEVVVEFDESKIKLISPEYTLTKKKIGVTDNARNTETYRITKSGNYKLHGYIQDSAGNRGMCDLDLIVNISAPSCELEVQDGTLGENDWYITDVEIGFKSMTTNSDTSSIVKYYIEKDNSDIENGEVIRAEQPQESVATYTFKEDMSATFTGYVIDSNGTEGKCNIAIKKDSTVPTCSLKVTSGKLNNQGQYTDNPIVEINEAVDSVSDIAAKGIGVVENYTETSYKVMEDGTTVVNGYVKDNAGNKGTCSLEINRPAKIPPTCTLTPDGNTYSDSVTVTVNASATSPATVKNFGISESATLNGQKTLTIKGAGQHTVYGMVEDSNGLTGTCSATYTIKSNSNEGVLASKVKVGDKVRYDAGNWDKTVAIPAKDGGFGGYTSGQSKNNSVKCWDKQEPGTPNNGWVVLSVSNGKVILVHAGTPECYYHGSNSNNSISKINSRASAYINSKYAESARILSCGDPGINCTQEVALSTPHITNTHYYLPSAKSSSVLWGVSYNGIVRGYSQRALGIRPIVVLKSDVMTSGQQNGEWILK